MMDGEDTGAPAPGTCPASLPRQDDKDRDRQVSGRGRPNTGAPAPGTCPASLPRQDDKERDHH